MDRKIWRKEPKPFGTSAVFGRPANPLQGCRRTSPWAIWGIGYDVSAKGYRSFWIMSMSSHLWKGVGTLSEDGNTMTIDCVGPSMGDEDGTANYRDVIEIIDENHRTLTSFGESPDGSFMEFMKVHYYRV